MRLNWDMLGMSASIACAIHCAVLPIFLTALPLFGWEILHNPWFEGGMIALAGVIGGAALYHGYKRHHRRKTPAMLFGAGFACLILKEVFHAYHLLLLIPAVVLIVAAHVLNLKSHPHPVHASAQGEEPATAKAA